MKVLVLALKYYPDSGGSALYAYNLAAGLHRQGCDVWMLAAKYPHRDYPDAESPFKIHRMFGTSPRMGGLRIVFAALNVLLFYFRFKPDVTWASAFAGCRTLGLVPFLNMHYVGTIHGGGIQRLHSPVRFVRWLKSLLGNRFIRRAQAVVTVSESAKKLILESLQNPVLNDKLHIVYSSIDFHEDQFLSREAALESLPALKNKMVILTVARLVKAKGQDVMIEALPKLLEKYPDLLYVIVGEGIEKEALKELIRKKNLSSHVLMTDYVDERALEAYYAACDLFILPGRWTPTFVEGFGAVLIEAGIRGKPVIGARVGGIPEAVYENKTGFLFEPENVDDLTSACERLLADAGLRKTFGNFARSYVKERFSNSVMAENNMHILRQLTRVTPS